MKTHVVVSKKWWSMSGRKRWLFVKKVGKENSVSWTLVLDSAELYTKEQAQQIAHKIRDRVAVSYAKEDAKYLCIE